MLADTPQVSPAASSPSGFSQEQLHVTRLGRASSGRRSLAPAGCHHLSLCSTIKINRRSEWSGHGNTGGISDRTRKVTKLGEKNGEEGNSLSAQWGGQRNCRYFGLTLHCGTCSPRLLWVAPLPLLLLPDEKCWFWVVGSFLRVVTASHWMPPCPRRFSTLPSPPQHFSDG